MRAAAILMVAAVACTATARVAAGPPEGTTTTLPMARSAGETTDPLVLLTRLEEKNRDLTSLYGEFRQVRKNEMLLDETISNGKFWYAKPDRFRADYEDKHPSQFWLIGNKVTFYTPELKQVERSSLPEGDNEAVNQMLLGFGVKVEKLKQYFRISQPATQPNPGLVDIVFDSRDPQRTLGFVRITLTIDPAALAPRKLFLEEESSEDVTSIELLKTEKNAPIAADKFDLSFPKDAVVLERDKSPSFSK